ncbi:MAG: hypothetical protein FD123_3804 [Bacteroidetes bacterium]|nr:MAG: hypothetical protein FD123_3804 [Bacteroidota bacterium]
MKKYAWIVLILFCCAWKNPDTRGTLKVRVYGLRNASGFARVSLYNKPDTFLQEKGALWTTIAAIYGNEAVIVFKDTPAGGYAVAVLHDENANAKMDYNWLGIPAEGYGFSRVHAPVIAKPSFVECKLTVEAGKELTTLVMVGY